MVSKTTRIIARLLWGAPALLLFLTVHQVKVAKDLKTTLEQGTVAKAEVVDFFSTGRSEIAYEYVSLRIRLDDGQVMEQEKMSLPHALYPKIEGKDTLAVRVLPGAAQEVVIDEIGQSQWRIAGINALMSLMGLLLLSPAVFLWNRYLSRKGDPALVNGPVAG